jgi:hypothetical protein
VLKYLRIAVTALSLTACVLLVALWVRSYRWLDNVNVSTAGTTALHSFDGAIGFVYSGRSSSPGVTSVSAKELRPLTEKTSGEKTTNWYFDWNRTGTAVRCPHWFVTLLLGIFAAVPWLHWNKRFSLRTLLIATTLVAVGLGLIVVVGRS